MEAAPAPAFPTSLQPLGTPPETEDRLPLETSSVVPVTALLNEVAGVELRSTIGSAATVMSTVVVTTALSVSPSFNTMLIERSSVSAAIPWLLE